MRRERWEEVRGVRGVNRDKRRRERVERGGKTCGKRNMCREKGNEKVKRGNRCEES